MKWIKRLFILSFLFGIIFGGLLTLPGVQKFFFKSLLKHRFESVSLKYIAIKWSGIKLEDLELKEKDQTFFVKNLNITWNLWDLIKLQGFNIHNIRSEIIVEAPTFLKIADFISKNNKNKSCLASSEIPFLQNKSLKGILPLLQWPLKLWIGEVNINIIGKSKAKQDLSLSIVGGSLAPKQEGIFKWNLSYSDIKPEFLAKITGNGRVILVENSKGRLDRLQVDGILNLHKQNEIIPLKTVFKAERVLNSVEINEIFYMDMLLGDSSELEIEGEFLKNGPKKVAAKWHLDADNTILKLFYPIEVPSYLICFNGQATLMRGSNALTTKATIEGWVKNLEIWHKSLYSTPPLKFKCEFGGKLEKKFFTLSELRLGIKNGKTEENFFKGYLLCPIAFDIAHQQLCGLKNDTRLFEGTLFTLPLALANPFLDPFNVELSGNILGSEFELSWIEKTNKWQVTTEQPLVMKSLSVDIRHQPWLTDVDFKINPKINLNKAGQEGLVEVELELLDRNYRSLISANLNNQFDLGNNKLRNLHCNGNVNANLLAVSEQPFWMLLAPQGRLQEPLDLKSEHSITIDCQKDLLTLQSLKLKVENKEATFANLEVLKGISINLKDPSKISSSENEILSLYLKALPLKIFSPFLKVFASINLQGTVGYEGVLIKEQEKLCLKSTKPCVCKDFKLDVSQGWLHIPYMRAFPELTYKQDRNASVKLQKIYLEGIDRQPLLDGTFSCTLEKASDWKINEALLEGKVRWDEWFLQPLFVDLPPWTGDFSTQLHYSSHKFDGYVKTSISPIRTALYSAGELKFNGEINKDNYKCEGEGTAQLKGNNGHSQTKLKFQTLLGKKKPTKATLDLSGDRVHLKDCLAFGYWAEDFWKELKSKIESLHTLFLSDKKAIDVPAKSEKPLLSKSGSVNDTLQKAKSLKTEKKAPWADYEVLACAQIGHIFWDEYTVKDFLLKLQTNEKEANLEKLSFRFGETSFITESHLKWNKAGYDAKITSSVKDLFPHKIFALYNSFSKPPLPGKYNVIYGPFDADLNLQTEGMLPEECLKNVQGRIKVSSQNGTIEPLKDQSYATKTVLGLATAASAVLGSQIKSVEAIGIFTNYFQKIPYNTLNIEILRGKDYVVRLREASLTNNDLHIFAEGFLEQLPTKPFDQQPLEIDTTINVRKGQLMDYIKLDLKHTDSKGYFIGPRCTLRGTISNLDYKDFLKLLDVPESSFKTNVKGKTETLEGTIKNIFDSIF